MILDYIYHSGFAIEAEGVTLIIDYYKDSSETELNKGIVHDRLLQRPGKLYVLASHFHPDHFNREVLTWKEQRPDIIYIFSKDILKHHRAQKEDAIYINKGEEYEDDMLRIQAFGSTDVGISFLIHLQGKHFSCRCPEQLALERRIYRTRDTQSRRRLPGRDKISSGSSSDHRPGNVSRRPPNGKRLHERSPTIHRTNKNYYICTHAL